MWVRGLKQKALDVRFPRHLVASYVGAWIETIKCENIVIFTLVASYVGAWIETHEYNHKHL